MRIKKYLKMEQCEDGYLYFISARNDHVGISRNGGKEFQYARHKFDDYYLSEENHYDTGAPFGTVHPIMKLEKAPQGLPTKELLFWLIKRSNEEAHRCPYCGEPGFAEEPLKCPCQEKEDYCKKCGNVYYNCVCGHEED